MSAVLGLTTVNDTKLWQKLAHGYQGNEAALGETLARNLVNICQEATDRVKGFAANHPQYTLHDEAHFLKVTYLMGKIIPDTVMDKLNPVEVALLILSAYLHDQGMVMETAERSAVESDASFQSFQRNWELEHPNVQQIRQRIRDEKASDEEVQRCVELDCQLRAAMFTDYVRTSHADRSARYIREHFSNDQRLEVGRTNLAEYVARLSSSHVKPSASLNPEQGYHYDESIGIYRVNLPYLGLVLRLADILDFDRDRVPEALRKTIHFTSAVSIQEWSKHGSVDGWVIDQSMIRFTMR